MVALRVMAKQKKTAPRVEPSFKKKQTKAKAKPGAKSRSGAKRRTSKTARGKAKSSNLLVRFIKWSSYWCFVLGLWGAIGVGAIFAYYGAKMPNATSWAVPTRPPNVKIVSSDGRTIANRGLTGGQALLLSDMSPYIPQAVIAIEDRRFYSHFGIDPIGLLRAVYSNFMAGRTVQGGSTLTQQLAKNLFLSPDRTIERKIQEVMLSIWLEQKFTKDQILEMYLNRVYFGSGAYGVEAATRRYFQKPASDANLAESALIAGLLKAPSRLSPARNPDAAEARGQIVLGAMQRAGFISTSEATSALTHPQTRAKSYWTGSENFAADRVMDDLKDLIGDVKEDLVIVTTLDYNLQKNAEVELRAALDKNGKKFNVKEGAMVALDGSGAIRVLIGGRNYATSQFDRASEALRQPGSAFKPFVYTAALEQGRTPDSIRNDAPVRIGKWTPQNYDQKYRGPVTLTQALSKSLNTIAAQLVMEVGPKTVTRTARRLGIEAKLKSNASIALGTSEVTLLELTSAYAPFMNGGFKATPHIIKRISTADGQFLFENTFDNPPRVLSPNVVTQMNVLLTEVVRSGTGKKAQIDNWQVAGKTGTSQSFRDALFIGYTANLTAGVWLGNDDGKPTKKVTGGGLPAQIWQRTMSQVHQGTPVALLPPVTVPSGLSIDGTLPAPADFMLNNDEGLASLVDGLQPVPSMDTTSSIPIPAARPLRRPAIRAQNNDVNIQNVAQSSSPRPPASVGGQAKNAQANRQKTILDVILGN
jgi:penicillin-binding protein 1A